MGRTTEDKKFALQSKFSASDWIYTESFYFGKDTHRLKSTY